MSNYTIDILDELESDLALPLPEVHAAALAALRHQAAPQGAGVSILLSDDAYLQRLNREFLGYDQPTDVLSFPSGEPVPVDGDGGPYLGDIAISVPAAERQALAGGHSLGDELSLLTVHGVLHLLGHDHAAPDETERMWLAQAEILRELGVDPAFVPNPGGEKA